MQFTGIPISSETANNLVSCKECGTGLFTSTGTVLCGFTLTSGGYKCSSCHSGDCSDLKAGIGLPELTKRAEELSKKYSRHVDEVVNNVSKKLDKLEQKLKKRQAKKRKARESEELLRKDLRKAEEVAVGRLLDNYFASPYERKHVDLWTREILDRHTFEQLNASRQGLFSDLQAACGHKKHSQNNVSLLKANLDKMVKVSRSGIFFGA